MFTEKKIKERLDAHPFRPFRLHMSDGKTYDVPNHDAAWVRAGAVVVGIELNRQGFALLVHECAILHIASIEELQAA